MKLWLSYVAIGASALLLQGCGGSGVVGDKTRDRDDLIPIPVVDDGSDRPRPGSTIPVMKTNKHEILDVNGKPVLLRGINVLFSQNPSERLRGINTLADSGANIVRLQITEATTEAELESALIAIRNKGMIALVTLTGPKITCVESDVDFIKAVDELWLKKWLPVLAQDRFQSNLMIGIADGWGPNDIFNMYSKGYADYADNYKAAIQKFRAAGFKIPLVVDAPHCGQDFNAFLSNRGQELVAADSEKNVVLSAQVEDSHWDTSVKIENASANLYNEDVPYFISAFSGSDVGEKPIDHKDLMKKAVGEHAMEFNLPWAATDDSAAYAMTLKAPIDLSTGSTVSIKFYLDKIYSELVTENSQAKATGKLGVLMYLKDSNGNRLKLGTENAQTMRFDVWSNLRFEGPKDQESLNVANLMNGATTFDLKSVAEVGVAIMANGKAAKVKAPIKVDDLTIFPGSPPPTLAVDSTFNSGADGWARPDWSAGNVVFADGYAKLTPGDWGPVLESQEVAKKINFKQTVFIDMKVFVPASYAGKTPSFTFTGNFGSDWKIEPAAKSAAVVGELKYGEWNDYRAVLKWGEGYDVSAPQNLKMQLGDVGANTEPLLIDSITITQQEAKRTKTVTALQYESRFSKSAETYAATWGTKAKVEQVDGELNITPQWKNDKDEQTDDVVVLKGDIYSINDIDVSGPVTYKVRIFVPASYAGSELDFEIFTQDSTWTHDTQFPGRHLTIADFKPGEWTSFVFNTDEFAPGFTRTQKLRHFGFRWKGVNFNGDTVKIDDIQLYGNKQVDDSEPVLSLDFSTQAQVDGFKSDFVSGSFNSSGADTAKGLGFNVSPFGWIASTWIGGTGAHAGLDISSSDSALTLTTRGGEIVNDPNGIKATSILATPRADASAQ